MRPAGCTVLCHDKERILCYANKESALVMQIESSPALQRLVKEDAVGQLRRGEGRMAQLGSEADQLKLDWVEGVARLLENDAWLEEVEAQAQGIWESGIRHIIWAGMGGSVITVRVLCELGFCGAQDGKGVTIYPLDSTDPAALNAIVSQICQAKNLALPTEWEAADSTFLRMLCADVMIVGVSMGMTSEEPITHLKWFTGLIVQAQLHPADHLLVMTLPNSYLDVFAHEHHVPSLPLQLDGRTGTGGRMSAPATRVFLLPAALYLTRSVKKPGQLRAVLRRAWEEYNLALATLHPAEHPFVQLAAVLSDTSLNGVCRLLLHMPVEWQPCVQWVEQLMEESLGKQGKGVLVFHEQPLNTQAPYYRTSDTLHVYAGTTSPMPIEDHTFTLPQEHFASQDHHTRLVTLAANFMGWQLSMALYGYLHGITFAGQPAVENYKARARVLRDGQDPLQAISTVNVIREGILTLAGVEAQGSAAETFARALLEDKSQTGHTRLSRLDYLDLTVNGELAPDCLPAIDVYTHTIANDLLGVPFKLRQAPADYHSTEQSEMDGSPYFVSLRLLAREHAASLIGNYTDTFLCAQAVSTWQAMREQGRRCYLLIVDGSAEEAGEALQQFFHEVAGYVTSTM